MATLTSNAGNETTLDAFFATRKIKLKPAVLSSLKEDYGIQEPNDFKHLDDVNISTFVQENNLGVATKNKFESAYCEIKYGDSNRERFRSTSPRSRTSSTHSRSGSLVQVDSNDTSGSFIVKGNYRIRKDQPLLSGDKESHCDVLLAETTDYNVTPLVAKMSTDATSAAALSQEYKLLHHIRQRLGTKANDFIVKLIDWVEQ